MAVDVKQVAGRRTLRFASPAEMLHDVERLAASPSTRMLGNWPLERLLAHLTLAINGSVEGISERGPWFFRLIGPLVKRRIIARGMSPGFKVSKQLEGRFYPATESLAAEVDRFRAAVARIDAEPMTAVHPVFGRLTHDEWTQLHLRHAEMHLSFALPE